MKNKPSAQEQLLLHAEQVKQLYKNSPLGLIGTAVNFVVLTYVQWNVVPHQAALIWFVCLSLITLLRYVQFLRYWHSPVSAVEAGRWGTWFILGTALSGLAWGAAVIFLFPVESTSHQIFLAFVMGGLVAGAAGTYSVILRAYLAYSIPVLVPLILRFFFLRDEIHVIMGGLILLFAILTYGVAMRVHTATVMSLRLRFENNNLISYLASAKERAEKLNQELISEIAERNKAEEELKKHREHLEELVEARTAEWSSANTQLQKEVAERKMAVEVLKQSAAYFRLLIENALDLITVLDSNGNILFESPSIERLLGYGQDELVGKNVFELVHPDDGDAARAALIRRIKEPGVTESVEVRIRHANGSWRHLEAIGKSLVDDSNTVRIIINSRDNTERKKLEEDVLKAQKLESLGILAGGIAHDFNNLLTGIMANIEMAKLHVERDHELFIILKKAEQASIRAKDLTQQLLTFSLGGAPVRKVVLIGHLVEESAGFALRGSKVRCNFSIHNDLRPVEADEGQLHQVIHNIVLNADQAMPEGGVITVTAENVTLGAHEVPSLSAGEYVKVSIQDYGIGIPQEHLVKIFDPYFTTKHKGSGLGLATAYSIIKKHGGAVSVESVLGAGTTFNLYLPVSRKAVSAPEGASKGLVLGKGRVLVMDDEAIVRDASGLILKTAGYEVEFAKDGNQAIERYRNAYESGRPFDVVILDLTVPGGTGGKETIKRLLEINPAVKAIVSSGYSQDPIMANYKDFGFRGVIVKPYKPWEMSDVVDKILTRDP